MVTLVKVLVQQVLLRDGFDATGKSVILTVVMFRQHT
jgi:hypothetical protein